MYRLQAGIETVQRSFPVYQHHQRPDCQSKINFGRFSSTKLNQQRYCACMLLRERFAIFLINMSCQSSYLQWKLVGLIFSAVSGMETGVEMENLQRSEQAHFLILWVCCSILCLRLCCTRLCSSTSLVAGLPWRQSLLLLLPCSICFLSNANAAFILLGFI